MANLPLPPNVVSGEFITSTWGNQVVNEMKDTDRLVMGAGTGGTIASGGSATIATLILPRGVWSVHHSAYLTSTAAIGVTVKGRKDGVDNVDWSVAFPLFGATSFGTVTGAFPLDLSALAGAATSTITFVLINGGTQNVTAVAVPAQHWCYATQCRFG